MIRKIFTTAIIMGVLAGISVPETYAVEKLTRKQKKEIALMDKAKSNFENQQYDLAIEFYTRAIEVNAENPESYAKRGNARFLIGNYKDAVIDYTKAIELDPKRENLYYNRGIAKANLSLYEDVIEDYTKELELNPVNVNAYLNRGSTQVLMKRLKIFL